MKEVLTFSIGRDGDVTVRSYRELDKWIEAERDRWTWMTPGDGRTDRLGLATELQASWTQVINSVQQSKAQDQPLEYVGQFLGPLSSGLIAVSTTTIGATVLDILESAGDVAAMAALGFLKQRLNTQNATLPEEFLGLLLAVIPDLRSTVDWTEQLKRERTNFRMASRTLQERVDAEAGVRDAEALRLFNRGRAIATRIFNMRRNSWRAVETEWRTSADNSVAEIQSRAGASLSSIELAERSYREFMRLKAPVEYWEKKGEHHAAREARALKRLYWYFPATLGTLAVVFICAAIFLLNHPDTQSAKAPFALYVVVSGGLLLVSTIAFWVGRLLTKLYLSEHHLRNDAEERATMTTTYLALTSENAASESDRQIILNALFRSTPDGIVREDGPGDVGLQGMLAKLLAK